MWTPPNFPEGTVRTELHLSGPEEIMDFLYDLIMELSEPFYGIESLDEYRLIYTSPEAAKEVFAKLHETLNGMYPGLIGHPDGVTIEDDVRYFKGC